MVSIRGIGFSGPSKLGRAKSEGAERREKAKDFRRVKSEPGRLSEPGTSSQGNIKRTFSFEPPSSLEKAEEIRDVRSGSPGKRRQNPGGLESIQEAKFESSPVAPGVSRQGNRKRALSLGPQETTTPAQSFSFPPPPEKAPTAKNLGQQLMPKSKSMPSTSGVEKEAKTKRALSLSNPVQQTGSPVAGTSEITPAQKQSPEELMERAKGFLKKHMKEKSETLSQPGTKLNHKAVSGIAQGMSEVLSSTMEQIDELSKKATEAERKTFAEKLKKAGSDVTKICKAVTEQEKSLNNYPRWKKHCSEAPNTSLDKIEYIKKAEKKLSVSKKLAAGAKKADATVSDFIIEAGKNLRASIAKPMQTYKENKKLEKELLTKAQDWEKFSSINFLDKAIKAIEQSPQGCNAADPAKRTEVVRNLKSAKSYLKKPGLCSTTSDLYPVNSTFKAYGVENNSKNNARFLEELNRFADELCATEDKSVDKVSELLETHKGKMTKIKRKHVRIPSSAWAKPVIASDKLVGGDPIKATGDAIRSKFKGLVGLLKRAK